MLPKNQFDLHQGRVPRRKLDCLRFRLERPITRKSDMSKREILGVSIASVIAVSAWVIAPQATAQMGMMGPGYGHGMMYGPQWTTPGYGPGMMGGCPMMGMTTDGQA